MIKKALVLILSCIFLVMAVSCGSKEEKKMKFYNKGMALFEDAEYIKASLEFKNALQIDPKFTDAYYMLGKTALAQREIKQAFGYFGKNSQSGRFSFGCPGRNGSYSYGCPSAGSGP